MFRRGRKGLIFATKNGVVPKVGLANEETGMDQNSIKFLLITVLWMYMHISAEWSYAFYLDEDNHNQLMELLKSRG